MSKYGVFSGVSLRIESELYSVRMRENTDQKKLRIWTLFAQCHRLIYVKIRYKPTIFSYKLLLWKKYAYKMLSLKKAYDREALLYYEEQYYIKVSAS